MKEIGAGIYQLNLGLANVYLLEGRGGLALVDAGGQGALRTLQQQLRRTRFRPSDISHILVTHGHFDHVGGLVEIQAETAATVWAHHLDAPIIRGDAPVSRPEPRSLKPFDRWIGQIIKGPQLLAPVHRELGSSEDLGELRTGLRVVHLPGHSAGQVGFWLSEARLLLGGDVLTHFVPWRLTLPLAAYTADMAEAKRSVFKVAQLRLDTLALGHGTPLVGNAQHQVGAAVRRLRLSAAAQTGSSLLFF